jgi:hypothetical protein
VLAALTTVSKESENFSLERRTALRPLPEPPTKPSTFRLPRILMCPSEVSDATARDRRRRHRDPSSRGIDCSFRVLHRSVSPLLVRRSHSAVSPRLGLMVFPSRVRRVCLTNPPATLFEFRLPPESFSAAPSRPPRRSVGGQPLSWAPFPFSTSRVRGSTSRGFASPAKFRPQGLATLSTACSPRARAGLVSYRQRSWDFALRSFPFPKGIPGVSTPAEPACRFHHRILPRRIRGSDRWFAAPGL